MQLTAVRSAIAGHAAAIAGSTLTVGSAVAGRRARTFSRFVQMVKDLQRVAFDPTVEAAERAAFLAKAIKLAGKYGIELGVEGVVPDGKPSSSRAGGLFGFGDAGFGDDVELLPDPADPLAVARVLVVDWQDRAAS